MISNILILDDDQITANKVKCIISKHYKNINIDIYQNLDSPINILKYSIFFLEIDIGNIKALGFNFASYIKSINENKIIIFITSKTDYMKECFKYMPFRFIDKHYLIKDLTSALNDLDKYYLKHNITIKFKQDIINISIFEILYMQRQRNKVIIKTLNNEYIIYKSLKEILNDLRIKSLFLKINSGTIVNKNYIIGISNNNIILYNNIILSLSRSYAQRIKKVTNMTC